MSAEEHSMSSSEKSDHKGFVGGYVYCPKIKKRVEMHETYAGFFVCPGCDERIEGLKWS